jgi:hypothetical protein
MGPTLTYAEGSIGPLNLDASRHKQSASTYKQRLFFSTTAIRNCDPRHNTSP